MPFCLKFWSFIILTFSNKKLVFFLGVWGYAPPWFFGDLKGDGVESWWENGLLLKQLFLNFFIFDIWKGEIHFSSWFSNLIHKGLSNFIKTSCGYLKVGSSFDMHTSLREKSKGRIFLLCCITSPGESSLTLLIFLPLVNFLIFQA